MRPHEDSNLDCKLRKLVAYPLADGGTTKYKERYI